VRLVNPARLCFLTLPLALLPAGCRLAPPEVRVVPRSEQELHRDLDTCALHSDVPSARTSWLLRLMEAEQEFAEDPIETLRLLHGRLLELPSRPAYFSLAELAYLAGERRESRDCFLAAAVYAYLYLLSAEGTPPSPYDRHFRWACDIYNRSLVRALMEPRDESLELEPGRRTLPTGFLDVAVDLAGFPFETQGLQLLPADALEVRGLGFRVRDSGLGAPLIAVVKRRGEGTAGVGILDRTSVSATLFLRIQGELRDIETGVEAVLELHSTYDATTVAVGEERVPLEADPSATIAYGIERADLGRFDLRGLFRGKEARKQNGLILLRPFMPGRIPVVLVHGTASNPSKWAELINSLHVDPLIRGRVQFWLFIYATGNPVVYSAATLRDSLQEMVRERDPEGTDEALKHMIVVGHSQGGLLAKMTGIRLRADDFARSVLGSPLEELELSPQSAQLLRRCFDVDPLPMVDRIVFVSTPHRGSFLAASWFARMFAKMIAVPGEIVGVTQQIVGSVPERLPKGLETRVPTSLDNMNPANPSLKFLAQAHIDPRVHVHSIVAIGKAKDPAKADDGVVAYSSAHLEDAESELLVPSGHSCQSHPRTIIELRRILREHISAFDALQGSKP
jgi:pimeloyl-ACP methyl ester carboxylesterase